MGRILVCGEPGQDIVTALCRLAGEVVQDQPGKSPSTRPTLRRSSSTTASTRSSPAASPPRCACKPPSARATTGVALADACASYFPEFHRVGLEMIKAQGGIFGWVSGATSFADAVTAGEQAA